MCWLATRSPTTDHNWGHQGWFRASNTNGRSRCGKPGEQSVPPATRGALPSLVAPGVLVHLQAAASVTLLFNALLRSQNRFPGFPAFQTHLNNAKGWSCTRNMADSEWLDELSWYKRPVPLECFELRSCTQFWILFFLVAAGVWVQTKACCQTGKLFVIGTWGQWPRKMQVTAVHSNLFGRKNEKKSFKQVIVLSCGQQYD